TQCADRCEWFQSNWKMPKARLGMPIERAKEERDERNAEPRRRARTWRIRTGRRGHRIAVPALPAVHHHRAFPDRPARADRLARARLFRLRPGRRDAEDAEWRGD